MAKNAFDTASDLFKRLQQTGGNIVRGLSQPRTNIGSNQPNFQPYINTYKALPQPIQRFGNQAVSFVARQPLLTNYSSPIPTAPKFSPTIGEYAKPILNNLRQTIDPRRNLIEKGLSGLQAGYSVVGAPAQVLTGIGAGTLKGIRTKSNINKSIKHAIVNPTSGIATTGLGIHGILGSVGDIALSGNPLSMGKSALKSASKASTIAKELVGINPRAFAMHPQDIEDAKYALDILKGFEKGNKAQAMRTVQNLLEAYAPGYKYSKNSKAYKVIEALIHQNEGELAKFPKMGIVSSEDTSISRLLSEQTGKKILQGKTREGLSQYQKQGIEPQILESQLAKETPQSVFSSKSSISNTVNPLVSRIEPKVGQVSPEMQSLGLNEGFQVKGTQTEQGAKGLKVQTKPIGNISSQSSSEGIISNAVNKLNKLYTQTLDRFHPISTIAKKANEDLKMRRALTGYYGAGSTAQYHVDYELAPILQSANIKELRDAAIAQRDIELTKRGIQGSNKNLNIDVNNLTPQTKDALAKLYSYQDNLVQEYLVKTGIMSPESYAAMKAQNQNYVPFKRVMDQVDDYLGGVPQTKSPGSVGSQSVIKGIKGSEKEIHDPLESIVENTYKIVGLGKRQDVAKTIVGLQNKLPPGMIQKVSGKLPFNKNDVIALFENGKVQHYKVPQEVAEAAKGMNEEQMNMLVNILAAPTRVFRATATGINPEFAIPNVARDLQSAFVNVGLNPLNWVSGLAHMIKRDDVYQEFLKSGGMTSRISLDRPYLKKTVSELAAKGPLNKGIEVTKPGKLYGLLQALGQYSEQPTRIASFQKGLSQSLKKGVGREDALKDAAYAAQEGTVNFARRGSKTQSLNAIYAFLNARAQGVDRLIRSVKADPKGAGIRLGLISVAPAIATYAWNKQFPSYNNDRVVPQYVKDNNFVIMLSDKPISSLGGAQYITIPKGEVGKLGNPIEAFMNYAEGKGGDVAGSLGSVLSAFSPISNIGDIIPTALRPPIENAANHNFFYGSPIVAESKKNYPAPYQTSKSTPAIYNQLGQLTNQSPNMIQNLVRGYGTGIARIGEQLTQPFAKKDNYSGSNVNQTPIIRRFLQGEVRSEGDQAQIDSYKLKDLQQKIQDIRSGIKYGNIPEDVGTREIQKLMNQVQTETDKQSQNFFGPQEASAAEEVAPGIMLEKGGQTIADQIAEDNIRASVKTSGKPQAHNGQIFYKKGDRTYTIDLTSKLEDPEFTGNTEVDKKILSNYSGEISKKINDITKLAQLDDSKTGKPYISFDQAETLIEGLKQKLANIKSQQASQVSYDLTGDPVIDKQIVARQKRAITDQINTVVDYVQQGKITAQQGRDLINRLNEKAGRSSGGSSKKRKINYGAVKITAKPIKVPNISFKAPRVKIPKYKKVKPVRVKNIYAR